MGSGRIRFLLFIYLVSYSLRDKYYGMNNKCFCIIYRENEVSSLFRLLAPPALLRSSKGNQGAKTHARYVRI